MEEIVDKYTIKASSLKKGPKAKPNKHAERVQSSKEFMASWLNEKETILKQTAKEALERKRQAMVIYREWKATQHRLKVEQARRDWDTMEPSHRWWLMGLYEDMAWDHSSGMSYARRIDEEYGVWEYYLDNANEIHRKYS